MAALKSAWAGVRPSHFRPDLQGLRAIAVVAVLLFHLDPAWLPGGYVGVDVFFVLSGFLITGLLLRELEQTGTINLWQFYSRRFRRLSPAGILVLAFCMAMFWILPPPRWKAELLNIIASALYLENWLLAWRSVDYLAAEGAASPVQHYWSLSIEEQFYLFWPLFLIASAAIAKRGRKQAKAVIIASIFSAGIISLLYSVSFAINPSPQSYFHTGTRIWELAAGGLIAVIGVPAITSSAFRLVLRSLGLFAILGACILYSKDTNFPGYAALLPVIGSALVILTPSSDSASRLDSALENRISTTLGDLSYAIYLWHWPVIVFARSLLGPDLSIGVLGLLAILILILSFLTKVLVEDRFRDTGKPIVTGGKLTTSLKKSLATIVVFSSACTAVLVALEFEGRARSESDRLSDQYVGARALTMSRPPQYQEPIPFKTNILTDLPTSYASGCHLPLGEVSLVECPIGPATGSATIALIGDSHAAQWLPAISELGMVRGWTVMPFTKSSCPIMLTQIAGETTNDCLDWSREVLTRLQQIQPDIIFVSRYTAGKSQHVSQAELEATMQTLLGVTRRVVYLADPPSFEAIPDQCWRSMANCRLRPMPSPPDHLATTLPAKLGYNAIDLRTSICPAEPCPMVIGNVVVWRDHHHMTALYSRSLAGLLEQQLQALNLLEP